MAFKFPKLTPLKIFAFISALFNLLGGTNVIDAPVDVPAYFAPAPVAPGASSAE